MNTMSIKVFQVDDWAYVAALSAEEAASFIEKDYDRPEDPDERELDEINPSCDAKLADFLQKFIESGETIPALIAIDGHYA